MNDRTAYHPRGLQTWDVWYVADAQEVHAYYLQKPSPDIDPSILRADWIGHATSSDLVTWTEHARALGPDSSSDIDDLQPWTGSAVLHEGTYYLYFTMRGSRTPTARVQRIGLATSNDGFTWSRHAGNPVLEPDPELHESDPTGVVDCRDLLVIPDPAGDGWWGFYAARLKDAPLSAGAVIAVAYSTDLVSWENRGQAFSPGLYACLEVPDVFELDGRWYLTCLVGNRYGNRGPFDGSTTNGTIYAVADGPAGPYRLMEGDVALLAGDITCGYSCRSVQVGDKRHLLYTEPTSSGRDSISPPLELRAGKGGALRLGRSDRMDSLRTAPTTLLSELRPLTQTPHWPQVNGSWVSTGDSGAIGQAESGWHVAADSLEGDCFEVEGTFSWVGSPAFGFAIGASGADTASGCVLVGVDLARGTAVAASLPDFADLVERRFVVDSSSVHLRVVVRGERVQFFIDDLLWLQFSRPWNRGLASGMGWYVENGTVQVSDAQAWILGEHHSAR